MIMLAAALVLVAASPADARKKPLTILHVNDTHSHLDPDRTDGSGGVIERTAFVDSVRKADGKRNVLYLHGGDFNQGTSYFTVLKGDLEVSLVNAAKFDCVTLGNHEFDNGLEELGRRLGNLNMPVVCANYDFSGFEAGKYVRPYTIIKRAGRKIGIIGMLCNIYAMVDYSVSSKVPKIGDEVELTNKWAAYLKDVEKCDIVILLSHMGYTDDLKVVAQTRNVDLVVGGHSHTLLDNMQTVTDLDGKPVRVVQDWCWGREVGVLKID